MNRHYRLEKLDGTFLAGEIDATLDKIEDTKRIVAKGERLISSIEGWLKDGEIILTGDIKTEREEK